MIAIGSGGLGDCRLFGLALPIPRQQFVDAILRVGREAGEDVCVPECPAEAIFPDTDPAATGEWLQLNGKYASLWPNITMRKDPMSEADALNGVVDRLRDFSPKPGEGDG